MNEPKESIGSWRSLSKLQFDRVYKEFATTVERTDQSWLDRRVPGIDNSIGWIAWHLTRGIDRNITEIAGRKQLWLEADWADRFGRNADPKDTGWGHTLEVARSFRSPSVTEFLGYHEAVQGAVSEYLATAPEDDYRRQVLSPTLDNVHTVEERLAAVLYDSYAHLGQIDILRSVALEL